MKNKKIRYPRLKQRHEFRWIVVLFFILIASMIGIITANLYKLQTETDKIANNYVMDVTNTTRTAVLRISRRRSVLKAL